MQIIGASSKVLMNKEILITHAPSEDHNNANDVYDQWCRQLNLYSSDTSGNINGTSKATKFNPSMMPSMGGTVSYVNRFMLSSSGILGLFDYLTTSTTTTLVTGVASRRLSVINIPPALNFALGKSVVDLTSENSKWTGNANGYCIYQELRAASGTDYHHTIVMQVRPQGIKVFVWRDLSTSTITTYSIHGVAFTGNNSTTMTIINQYNLGTIFDATCQGTLVEIGYADGRIDPYDLEYVSEDDGLKIITYYQLDNPEHLIPGYDYYWEENIVSIGDSAFKNKGLTSIEFSSSMMYIENSAFEDNDMTYLNLSYSSITSLPDNAFKDNLIDTLVLGSVTHISDTAFLNNPIVDVTIGSNVILSSGSLGVYGSSFETAYNTNNKANGKYTYSGGTWTYTSPFTINASGVITAYARSLGGYNVVVPDTIGGITVTTIANSAFSSLSLTSIDMSAAVHLTSLGDYAFAYNYDLTSVIFSDCITAIGYGAFSYCGITGALNMPLNLVSIGGYAFNGVSGITSITFHDAVTSIGQQAFYNMPYLSTVNLPNNPSLYIDTQAFAYSGITTLNVKSSFTMPYNGNCFYGINLTKITLPSNFDFGSNMFGNRGYYILTAYESNFKTAGTYTWNGSVFETVLPIFLFNTTTQYITGTDPLGSDFINMIVPNSINSVPVLGIATGAFNNSSSLTSVTFEAYDPSITVEELAFANCPNLSKVVMKYNLEVNLGTDVFLNTSITDVSFPEGYNIPSDSTFGVYGASLRTLYNSMNKPEGRFIYTTSWNMKYPYIFNTVTQTITGVDSLVNNYNLVMPTQLEGLDVLHIDNLGSNFDPSGTLTLPANLLTVKDYAMYYAHVQDVIFPSTVTYIGESAFYNSQISDLKLPSGLLTMGMTAFENSLSYCQKIHIPSNVNIVGGAPWGTDSTFRNSYINGSYKGGLYSPSLSWAIKFGYEFGVIYGGYDAIMPNRDYYNYVIPEYIDGYPVLSLYNYSHETLPIRKLVIPSTLTSISYYAFTKCNLLSEIVFSEPRAVNITIGQGVFSNCTSLTKLVVPSTKVRFDRYAFDNTALVEITLPASYSMTSYNLFGTYSGGLYSVYSGNGELAGKYIYYGGVWTRSALSPFTVDIPTNTITGYDINAGTTNIVIPNIVLGTPIYHIGANAFKDLPITFIQTIQNGILSIGDNAFENTSLGGTGITLPSSLVTIGEYAFKNSNIGGVNLSYVTSLGVGAFIGCNFGNTALQTLLSVSHVPDHLFEDNNITEVTVPSNINSIGLDVFKDNTIVKVTIESGLLLDSSSMGVNGTTFKTLYDSLDFLNSEDVNVYTFVNSAWTSNRDKVIYEFLKGFSQGSAIATLGEIEIFDAPRRIPETDSINEEQRMFIQGLLFALLQNVRLLPGVPHKNPYTQLIIGLSTIYADRSTWVSYLNIDEVGHSYCYEDTNSPDAIYEAVFSKVGNYEYCKYRAFLYSTPDMFPSDYTASNGWRCDFGDEVEMLVYTDAYAQEGNDEFTANYNIYNTTGKPLVIYTSRFFWALPPEFQRFKIANITGDYILRNLDEQPLVVNGDFSVAKVYITLAADTMKFGISSSSWYTINDLYYRTATSENNTLLVEYYLNNNFVHVKSKYITGNLLSSPSMHYDNHEGYTSGASGYIGNQEINIESSPRVDANDTDTLTVNIISNLPSSIILNIRVLNDDPVLPRFILGTYQGSVTMLYS